MSDQISIAETIEALGNGQQAEIIKITNENPQYRRALGDSSEVWAHVSQNLDADLLPLIANISASVEGNQMANKIGVPQQLVSNCTNLCSTRSYWSALSNSSQMYSVDVSKDLCESTLLKIEQFPNQIIQFVTAQIRNGDKSDWNPLIYAALALYPQWYQQELATVDLFNQLISLCIDNGMVVEMLDKGDDLVLYQVIDAVQNARNAPVPEEFVFKIYQKFKEMVANSQQYFSDRDETAWPIFILQMEILTSILENDPEMKHKLTQKGIVQDITTLLANSKQHLPIYNKLNAAPTDLNTKDFPMLRSTAIALLSQVVVQNIQAQDQARELGGLVLVLECCIIDANNPYIKERAIICVRYLLENNQKSQDFIASLEAKQVADPEILEKAGFEAEFVDGKLVVKGKKPIR